MDLKRPSLMYLKAALFLLILLAASAVILILTRDWLVGAMLALVAWSAARVYYFMFYVIEHYVDGEYRFGGVLDFLGYVARGRRPRAENLRDR